MERRHLGDAEIAAAADGERAAPARARHLEHCGECRTAVANVIAIRAYVARTAAREVAPEHDIARLTLATIRAREEAVASANEAFGTFGGILRSIVGFTLGRQR